jgi:hypothetical protein
VSASFSTARSRWRLEQSEAEQGTEEQEEREREENRIEELEKRGDKEGISRCDMLDNKRGKNRHQ